MRVRLLAAMVGGTRVRAEYVWGAQTGSGDGRMSTKRDHRDPRNTLNGYRRGRDGHRLTPLFAQARIPADGQGDAGSLWQRSDDAADRCNRLYSMLADDGERVQLEAARGPRFLKFG